MTQYVTFFVIGQSGQIFKNHFFQKLKFNEIDFVELYICGKL